VTLDGCTRDVCSEHALGTKVRACAVATRIRPDVVSCSPGTPGWPGADRYRSGLQAAARAGVTVVAGTGLRHPAREEN
jgi:hypothetical protein